ncbi:MAG: gamma-glutamylcyclotransferase family protein [Promethearchaeota archaeon]
MDNDKFTSLSSKKIIFGYGTFITKKFYRRYSYVEPAFLPHYYRIFRRDKGDWFPFILHESELDKIKNSRRSNQTTNNVSQLFNKLKSGFWGLIFGVTDEELKKMDYYEGEGVLYKRIMENVILKNTNHVRAYLYYPTEETIEKYNLREYILQGDLWQEYIIKNYKEIIDEFPELRKVDPPCLII